MSLSRTERQRRYRVKIKGMIAGTVSPPPGVSIADIPVRYFRTYFKCGHRNIFRDPAPLPDEIHWCYGCMDYETVVKVNQETWIKNQQ